MKDSNFAFDVYFILSLESTCSIWVVGWVNELAENIAISALL